MPELRVLARQTLVIDGNYNPVFADSFVMEEHATVEVRTAWDFSCPRVEIGASCRIVARGQDGTHGPDEPYVPPQADQCKGGDGNNTRRGGNGTSGRNGYDLKFVWGIASVGALLIDTCGGNGGNGGHGGAGQKGGGATCAGCDGQKGSNGAPGGNSGSGGTGGAVILRWYYLSDPTEEERRSFADIYDPRTQIPFERTIFRVFAPGIDVAAWGGAPGIAGAGGVPGQGGDGVGCGLYDRGGGEPGGNGPAGEGGFYGNLGYVSVEKIPRP